MARLGQLEAAEWDLVVALKYGDLRRGATNYANPDAAQRAGGGAEDELPLNDINSSERPTA